MVSTARSPTGNHGQGGQTQRRSAQERVGEGVRNRIGAGVADEAEGVRNRHAAEDQRASGTETVRVVADPDANHATAANGDSMGE